MAVRVSYPDEAALGDDRIAAVAELNDEDLTLVAGPWRFESIRLVE